MLILRVEHRVPDFLAWKKLFDSDPTGRERSGVRRYRIFRSMDDPNFVMVDLEFDSVNKAEAFRAALRNLWGRVAVENPEARMVEAVESKEY